MADIRALLRNELASRRATDSNNPSTTRPTKKRKLEPEQEDDVRKKPKVTQEQVALEEANRRDQPDEYQENDKAAVTDASITAEPTKIEQEEEEEEEEEQEHSPLPSESIPQPATPPPQQGEPQPQSQSQSIDEDEWALFEREVAAPTKMIHTAPPAALMTGATISAAPLSAAELAEREKMDKQAQLRMREQEISFEKEDAARLLEEEFDEMDQLEERVRRLKEKRDEIRRWGVGVVEGEGVAEEGMGRRTEDVEAGGDEDEEDEDEDEDEEDEGWDNWRFR